MQLKFKTQAHQTAAVQAVLDCFKGQPWVSSETSGYRLGAGSEQCVVDDLLAADTGKNADLLLSDTALLNNIRAVQRRQNLALSDALMKTEVAPLNLDIEMETGTGKTYCYIKTIFELNRQYGWSKFIIVVPSIAIREGVAHTLQLTAEHFLQSYQRRIRFFIYASRQLHLLQSYASEAGINLMIINAQAFATRSSESRRIYEELDDFSSRKPIDVISATRPILILDEPQKIEGAITLKSLQAFRALLALRFSATHKTTHNKIYRLDALDAYNQKLVKKIAVRGITLQGQAGMAGYLYLQSIDISSSRPPVAWVEFEQKQADGNIKRVLRKLSKGDNLFALSNGLEQYLNGFVVADINAYSEALSFVNGFELGSGDVTGDVSETELRRIQIRESIKAHFEKEQTLFKLGVKVLTLFFIDAVLKYRDYTASDEKGEYARLFEEEYQLYLNALFNQEETPYLKYLKGIAVDKTHCGYFAIDQKSKRLTDPKVLKRGDSAGQSDDVAAYDLILKDKARLLSLHEPVRFIFSHSALREGWDNPNVFVICTLKHSDNSISRRQEVGRGLRLSVNQHGERIDHPAIVHDVNVLTVVASESYHDFVAALQRDIRQSLSQRASPVNASYFAGKMLKTATGFIELTPQLAQLIHRYLLQNAYSDDAGRVNRAYFEARSTGSLAALPPELAVHAEQVFMLIDDVCSAPQFLDIVDERKLKKNTLNVNFNKPEFNQLWQLINRKAVFRLEFDCSELVPKAIKAMNEQLAGLQAAPLQYRVQRGVQGYALSYEGLMHGQAFELQATGIECQQILEQAAPKLDLIDKLAEGTELTRRTLCAILQGLSPTVFALFKTNPVRFITEAQRLINEQKASIIIDHLAYEALADRFDLDVFNAGQKIQDVSSAVKTPERHIYDFVLLDSASKAERNFALALEASAEVVVYARLPRGFSIPTPLGEFNPGWAIAFKPGTLKHCYWVVHVNGSAPTTDRSDIEQAKIQCAHKFFDHMNRCFAPVSVRFAVVDSFPGLMSVVRSDVTAP